MLTFCMQGEELSEMWSHSAVRSGGNQEEQVALFLKHPISALSSK